MISLVDILRYNIQSLFYKNFDGTRLQNAGYEATIQEVMVDADRILHRVRIDGFESKEAAQATATALEDEFGVSQLWVGQTPVDT